MALTTPRTMPGVLELLPREQVAFQSMLDAIRRGFEVYGFLPVETPASELAEVLLTKSGGETERQVYFVQSTGALDAADKGVAGRPEHALRFDLTVPLARYVAEHERELAFPFRRYQMQRVYRGERAQRGRFREFYQCDIDVIGKDNLSIRYDAEMPAVIHAVFRALDIGAFTIWLNNRKLMRGFFEGLGIGDSEQQMAVLREVDKLDKRGAEYVREVLTGEGFGLSAEAAERILRFVEVRSTSLADAHAKLDALGSGSETFEQGRAELREAGLLETADSSVQVLVTQMDDAQLPVCLAIAKELRDAGIATEIALLVFIVYVPLGHWLFGTAPVGYETWLMALAGALVMAVCEEARKAWRRRVARPAHPPGRA